jgi:hypothetical protein
VKHIHLIKYRWWIFYWWVEVCIFSSWQPCKIVPSEESTLCLLLCSATRWFRKVSNWICGASIAPCTSLLGDIQCPKIQERYYRSKCCPSVAKTMKRYRIWNNIMSDSFWLCHTFFSKSEWQMAPQNHVFDLIVHLCDHLERRIFIMTSKPVKQRQQSTSTAAWRLE